MHALISVFAPNYLEPPEILGPSQIWHYNWEFFHPSRWSTVCSYPTVEKTRYWYAFLGVNWNVLVFPNNTELRYYTFANSIHLLFSIQQTRVGDSRCLAINDHHLGRLTINLDINSWLNQDLQFPHSVFVKSSIERANEKVSSASVIEFMISHRKTSFPVF